MTVIHRLHNLSEIKSAAMSVFWVCIVLSFIRWPRCGTGQEREPEKICKGKEYKSSSIKTYTLEITG
jgi:hypothetical protein